MDYKDKYSNIEVVDDLTGGVVRLGLIERINSDRKSKISNNFVSQVEVLDPRVLKAVVELLNSKLPQVTPEELILGMETSGIPMATALALSRGSKFNFSTSSKFGDYEGVFHFSEDHRNDKFHYFYGVNRHDSVIVVEDEITSGLGLITFIKALQAYEVKVLAVCAVVETLNFGAREKILTETGTEPITLLKIKVS